MLKRIKKDDPTNREMATATNKMATYTLVICIVTIVGYCTTTFFTCKNMNMLSVQIKKSDSTSDSTFKRMDNAINAFKIMAQQNTTLAEAAKKQAEASQNIANISDKSFKANDKNAKKTIQIMDSSNNIANRPYLLINPNKVDNSLVFNWNTNTLDSIKINFITVGKTPIYKLRVIDNTRSQTWDEFHTTHLDTALSDWWWNEIGDVDAGKTIPVYIWIYPPIPLIELVDWQHMVTIYGRGSYDDIFGKHHLFEFYYRIAFNPQLPYNCSSRAYNTIAVSMINKKTLKSTDFNFTKVDEFWGVQQNRNYNNK